MSLLISFVLADSSCEPRKESENYKMKNSWEKSLNSVRPFQRRSRKCISQSEAMTAIMFFRSARKHKLSKRRIKSCFLSSFVEFHSLIELNIFYFNFSMGTHWFHAPPPPSFTCTVHSYLIQIKKFAYR